MSPVTMGRLIWAARDEASRLHRLQVESARLDAERARRLERQDARVYHCPGCGAWRYRRTRQWRTCPTCRRLP